MYRTRSFVIVASLILSGQTAVAQDASRYRGYVLGSSLESVIAATNGRTTAAKTLHERPAKIQEMTWRPPYVSRGSAQADPVREVAFTFYDDALYRVVVIYDRDRTEGLSDADIVESVSASYGTPLLASARSPAGPAPEASPEGTEIARWENTESSVTLMRRTYSSEFRLVLSSKALSARARAATEEAVRLDALDAPRREEQRRLKDASDARAALDKARTANKVGFRP